MSLEKSGSTFIAQCDFCSNHFDTDEDEWQAAVDRMKKELWRIFKKMGEWFHRCPVCCELHHNPDDYKDVS